MTIDRGRLVEKNDQLQIDREYLEEVSIYKTNQTWLQIDQEYFCKLGKYLWNLDKPDQPNRCIR